MLVSFENFGQHQKGFLEMIPNSRIQKLCHISMSVWLITVEHADMA